MKVVFGSQGSKNLILDTHGYTEVELKLDLDLEELEEHLFIVAEKICIHMDGNGENRLGWFATAIAFFI